MDLDVLIIEDEQKVRKQIIELLNNKEIEGNKISIFEATDFPQGIKKIKENDYDIVILDLCKGAPSVEAEKPGYDVLKEIQSNAYTPVIFYSGIAHTLKGLSSSIVGVVNKRDGVEMLEKEILRIIKSKLGLIKKQIYNLIRLSLRDYFWQAVDKEKEIFSTVLDDVSLGYLMLRRIANSLSKEKIKSLLNDDKINSAKAHPMEFYIYPVDTDRELELGEIFKNVEAYYVLLTPSCDLIKRANGKRKTDKLLLAKATKLSDTEEFKNYIKLKNKEKRTEQEDSQMNKLRGNLKSWTTNNQGTKDRFFFLPYTPFLENRTIDFQDKVVLSYDVVKKFDRVAKLDDPFAQAMLSSFIRYYNRVGFPDLDSEYVVSAI